MVDGEESEFGGNPIPSEIPDSMRGLYRGLEGKVNVHRFLFQCRPVSLCRIQGLFSPNRAKPHDGSENRRTHVLPSIHRSACQSQEKKGYGVFWEDAHADGIRGV